MVFRKILLPQKDSKMALGSAIPNNHLAVLFSTVSTYGYEIFIEQKRGGGRLCLITEILHGRAIQVFDITYKTTRIIEMDDIASFTIYREGHGAS